MFVPLASFGSEISLLRHQLENANYVKQWSKSVNEKWALVALFGHVLEHFNYNKSLCFKDEFQKLSVIQS